jgi:hypothetical protein
MTGGRLGRYPIGELGDVMRSRDPRIDDDTPGGRLGEGLSETLSADVPVCVSCSSWGYTTTSSRRISMQYALLIYTRPGAEEALSGEEQEAISGEYMAIARGEQVTGGAHLQPAAMATTVRERDGQPVMTDGPFAETKEVFGGFYLVQADDLDAALAIAQRVPAVRLGGSVEVRPLMELPA